MGLNDWIRGAGHGLRAFARRLTDDARGNVAMLFGLTMPVLILITVGGVDIHRASTVRVNLQDALDAAALAAARSPFVTDADIQRVGMANLKANLKAYPEITLLEANTTFVLDDDIVIANGKVNVKTLVANIFMPPYGQFFDDYMPVGAHSEVDRSSRNIEVAMVLDVTGSMAGQRLIDLKAAAKDLIDIVVQPIQTPYYSKVALVPYSMGVNLGSQAASARGAIIGSTGITNAVINLAGTPKTISGATQARPVVITSASHGFSNNDVVWITGATGMTQLNNKPYFVRNKTTNTFELYNMAGALVDGRSWNAYTGTAGRVQKCQNNDCSITITSNNHGLTINEYVRITNVNGMTQINDQTFLVGNVTTNSFTIDLTSSSLTPYSSGGNAWCARRGCTYFAFENMYGDLTTNRISTCVSERTGAAAYTDAAPSSGSTRVGRVYAGGSNPCLGSGLSALSSNKTTLKSSIDGYVAQGSTAGQIGMAWGWYALAPDFNAITSSGSAAYNTAETLKAVVIMTDGEFNTPYCQDVIAQNAGSGSGSNNEKIGCDSTNGNAFAQGKSLCDGMKARGIVVYTVGFALAAGGDAEDLMKYCASTPSNFFLPASGGDLSEAFAAIGRDITKLRISK